jgi:hypothetical protein
MQGALGVIGWVLWGLVLLWGLGTVGSRNSDGGVRLMMRTQGFVLLVACAVTVLLPVSRYWLLAAIPVAFYLPMILMRRRAIGIEQRLKESDRSGEEEGNSAGLEPEVGKLIGWDQILRHVFRVLDFDRADTTIDSDGRVKATSQMRPYGYLRVESPILNQPILLPIIHRDDFWLAASVFDEPRLAGLRKDNAAELLIVYAPQKVLPGGLNGTPSHCLHYVLCPSGTLERYYSDSLGDQRMAKPKPEILFGQFVFDGQVQVATNLEPAI